MVDERLPDRCVRALLAVLAGARTTREAAAGAGRGLSVTWEALRELHDAGLVAYPHEKQGALSPRVRMLSEGSDGVWS